MKKRNTYIIIRGYKSMKKIFVLFVALIFLFSSCEKWFDINDSPNDPQQMTIELMMASSISSVAYVMGGKYQVLGALWSQHWTQSPGASQYQKDDSYDLTSSSYDNRQFGELYTGALKNLEYIRKEALRSKKWNYYLAATVMQCYTYQVLADLYNRIPFSEALKSDEGLLTPKYDNGQVVYDSLIARIDYALSKDFASLDLESIGLQDLLFNGDMDKWEAFANTLKLKIFLRQSEVRPSVAEAGIKKLYTDKDKVKFLSVDAKMTQFSNKTGSYNPLYGTEVVFLGNNPNLIMSNTLYSFMNLNGDNARLDALFDYPQTGGAHKALVQGNYNDPNEEPGTNSTSYSKPILSPTDPIYLMSLSESCFLQAEAIIRYGVDDYQEAKDLYEMGIEVSFARMGATGASDLFSGSAPYEFPSEGSSVEIFVQKIIEQKWVSLAGIQSLETFFEHNRTHYPKESTVPGDNTSYVSGEFTVAVNNVTSGRFPKRLIFPQSEYLTNPNTPKKKEVYEKIWWDVKTY